MISVTRVQNLQQRLDYEYGISMILNKSLLKILVLVLSGMCSQAIADERFQVIELQNNLKVLGFDPGPVDGIWGKNTLKAFCKFKSLSDSKCLPIIKKSDYTELKAAADASSFARSPENGLIWDMQKSLQILGYYKNHRTGFNDAAFLKGLSSYERKFRDLSVTEGEVDINYRNAQVLEKRARTRLKSMQNWNFDESILKQTVSTNKNTNTPVKRSTNNKIIQFGLIALGKMSGTVDGIWGNTSQKSLEIYLSSKGLDSKEKDPNQVIELIKSDLSKLNSRDIQNNIKTNLQWRNTSRKTLINSKLKPKRRISIQELRKRSKYNVDFIFDTEIIVDKNITLGGQRKVFVVDSIINSGSRFRNEFNLELTGKSLLAIIGSASNTAGNKEAYRIIYSGNANSLHINYKHDLGSPWQVAQKHRGKLDFIDSTCNVTLSDVARGDLQCTNADTVMIEPILPKGVYTVSLPSKQKVRQWNADKSLPWTVKVEDSYIEAIDFGIKPGVDLTIKDTKGFRGGISMCCRGTGEIANLRANQIYENSSWKVSSERGTAKLTLINSSSGGFWPTAWGDYRFTIDNSDLIDPALGANASMKINNSSLHMLSAFGRARAEITNSTLKNAGNGIAKLTATDSATIKVKKLSGLRQQHIYQAGAGRVILE